jgi:hypothetical protein
LKINERNKEVKTWSSLAKSLESHVCCDSGIQNPNLRPVTKPSKSTLHILDWIKFLSKARKAKKATRARTGVKAPSARTGVKAPSARRGLKNFGKDSSRNLRACWDRMKMFKQVSKQSPRPLIALLQ